MSKGMCCAASVWICSASSWSVMLCMAIFFTITEWPLTEVATARDLMPLSVKIFVIALATLPLSTIMESTTMSEASGSMPRWLTAIAIARASSTPRP
jgi:hypothetical protein